ncbi:MAG: hypothetical protein JRF31_09630 [Deltaproteobacteria bacterium]|nr:hypothetical protein [Deltaproteobacteria bacterium]
MICDNRCEIVEWKASNPHLVQEVASPNVNMDDARLLTMAKEKIVKENSNRTSMGCSSGCECIRTGDPKPEFLFKLNLTKIRYSGECVPVDQHIEPIHVEVELMP